MEKGEDTMSFVLLLEEYKVLLRNAQNPLIKKEKEMAVNAAIDKWIKISTKKLEPEALLKKISNLKQKAKAVSKNGRKPTDWQSKLLELLKCNDVIDPTVICVPLDGDEREKTLTDTAEAQVEDREHQLTMTDEAPGLVKAVDVVNFCEPPQAEFICDTREKTLPVTDGMHALVTADDIVNLYETPHTKLLTNHQLQRIVFLKQITVLELQQKKLEGNTCNTCNINNDHNDTITNNIDFEYIGFGGCDPVDVIEQ